MGGQSLSAAGCEAIQKVLDRIIHSWERWQMFFSFDKYEVEPMPWQGSSQGSTNVRHLKACHRCNVRWWCFTWSKLRRCSPAATRTSNTWEKATLRHENGTIVEDAAVRRTTQATLSRYFAKWDKYGGERIWQAFRYLNIYSNVDHFKFLSLQSNLNENKSTYYSEAVQYRPVGAFLFVVHHWYKFPVATVDVKAISCKQ